MRIYISLPISGHKLDHCKERAEGRTVHHGDASDMFNYIIIDDIL